MKNIQHKSLIREIAPGIIQIGRNPFDPILTLNDITKQASLAGDNVITEEDLEDISGNSFTYTSGQFTNRPMVGDKHVLIEGDIEAINLAPAMQAISGESDIRENADALINNSLNEISGLLEQSINNESLERQNNDALLSNSITIVSGLLYDQIESLAFDLIETNNHINTISGEMLDLKADLTSISGDITNISGVTYEEAENLAKKWSIIFG